MGGREGGREGEMVEVEGEDLWEGWQGKEKKGGRIEEKKNRKRKKLYFAVHYIIAIYNLFCYMYI